MITLEWRLSRHGVHFVLCYIIYIRRFVGAPLVKCHSTVIDCHCFRVHYPLPLPYVGKPDPRLLQDTIRQLQHDIDILKQQVIYTVMY